MLTTSSFHPNGNPSTQSSTFPSLNQSRHKQSQIGIKSLLLQSSLRKKRNGSLSDIGFQDQERKIMVCGGMERFQSIPRKIHLGTHQNLNNFPELNKDFHSLYPDNPGPNS
ncbi:hypothetical protein O181_047038 [Austropuccinia psidii MF-1]|uniref:Uncharacterized protein n=1 Tax=Austropuccinia psidii MF-1 TaxID=1389203 RepID=A0A9Q3HJ46_9BASI|nr:hypothetical protein [Austropuccinia psidii MF-1]